jgi:Zn-finger nucleic acid-binding protein
MHCPIDAAQLELRSVEGHSGYRCVSCRGAWLPAKYLESIKYSRRISTSAVALALDVGSSETKFACPHRCGGLRDSNSLGVPVKYCPSCRGIWFPKGELASFLSKHEPLSQGAGTSIGAELGANALLLFLEMLS